LATTGSVSSSAEVNIYVSLDETNSSFHYPRDWSGVTIKGGSFYVPPAVTQSVRETPRIKRSARAQGDDQQYGAVNTMELRDRDNTPTNAKLSQQIESHFGESWSSFREITRRFIVVKRYTIPGNTGEDMANNLYVPHIDLFEANPVLRRLSSIYRWMRGSLRYKFIVSGELQQNLRVMINPFSYQYNTTTANATSVTLKTALATKFIGGISPTTVIEVPYLGFQNVLYTPMGVPTGGRSLDTSMVMSLVGTTSTDAVVTVLMATSDDFRFSGFIGIRGLALAGTAPNYRNWSSLSKKTQESKSISSEFDYIEDVEEETEDNEQMSIPDDSRVNFTRLTSPQPKKRSARAQSAQGETETEGNPPSMSLGKKGIVLKEGKTMTIGEHTMKAFDGLATAAMPELPWSMADIYERHSRVDGFSWDSTQSTGTELKSYTVPFDLLKNDITKMPFEHFKLWRGHIQVKFQLNAIPMSQGRLIAYYLAGVDDAYFSEGFEGTDTGWMTTIPHVFLNPTVSTTGVLDIPFQHPYNYLIAGSDMAAAPQSTPHFLGQLKVAVFNPLQVGTGGSTTVDINVTAIIKSSKNLVITNRSPL
jgi:hypothetical protein